MTFSPSSSICVGEDVQMICFVDSLPAQQFTDSVAVVSFNGSTTAFLAAINDNLVIGVDTTRYTADTSGLAINTSRAGIRLTISEYQASDVVTEFICYGIYSAGVLSSPVSSDPPQFAGISLFSFLDG